jgi:hypothetical protein
MRQMDGQSGFRRPITGGGSAHKSIEIADDASDFIPGVSSAEWAAIVSLYAATSSSALRQQLGDRSYSLYVEG